MRILSVKVNNFYSFKELELDFTKFNGIVRILGENKDSGASNGAGKSVILESVVWGIYGKTIRRSTEDALVNYQEGSNCKVEIIISKDGVGEIQIIRCKRPTSLTLKVNDISSNKENASETQKFIEEILETDYKSFLASVVFGQHSEVTFLESSPEDKRRIIRNCFNLDDLFSKRTSVKQLKSSFQGELKTIKTFIEKFSKEIEEVKKNIPDSKYKFIELPSLEDILEAEKKILAIESKIKQISSGLKKNKDKVKKLKDSIDLGVFKEDKECPVCKGRYVKCQSHSDIAILEQELSSLTDLIKKDEEEINTLNTDKNLIIPEISSSLWAKYNQKNTLVLESQKYIDKLKDLEEQVRNYSIQEKTLEGYIEAMKFWELAFSEKGLIKYIIRNILDYFNLKTNEYLSILTNNQFTIEFNDELVEVVKNNGLQTSYISLSGGERRKVNLAIMLALQNLSAKISRTNCNLIFFDEVCDNIDDAGILAVNNLLTSLQENNPEKIILLISHNNLLQEVLSESQSITVVKKKGISRLSNGN